MPESAGLTSDMKAAQLAGYVAERTAYHRMARRVPQGAILSVWHQKLRSDRTT
jgi:hypothetical protein